MWTLFVLNPSVIYESHADARPDGTHTDWSAPQVLPTVAGKRWDIYLLPHVAPDGRSGRRSRTTRRQQDFSLRRHLPHLVEGRRRHLAGPAAGRRKTCMTPTYQNTTFREGIVNTFAVGPHKIGGSYPLYVSYEDGSSGLSNDLPDRLLRRWPVVDAPIRVNDNAGPTEALQPNLSVAPNGTVAVAFYDRRLPCPSEGDAGRSGSGVALRPGTDASPGTRGGARTTASIRRSSSTSRA